MFALSNSAIQIRQGWHNFPQKGKCQRFRSSMAASRATHCPSTETCIKEKKTFFLPIFPFSLWLQSEFYFDISKVLSIDFLLPGEGTENRWLMVIHQHSSKWFPVSFIFLLIVKTNTFFFLNNSNNKKEQLKNPKTSWQIPFKYKKSRTRQHWDVIYVLPFMSMFIAALSSENTNAICASSWTVPMAGEEVLFLFFYCVHQNNIRSAQKKCLESVKEARTHWAPPAFSCSWLLMSTYEGEETSSPSS